VAASADEFVTYASTLLADTVTVHHGHMPEIALTSTTTATGVWAMSIGRLEQDRDARADVPGLRHYSEEYEKGADGRWRIKRIRLTRIRVDHPNPEQ